MNRSAATSGGNTAMRVARLLGMVIVCMAIYACFIPQIMATLNPLTGDEPFYVMTVFSLVQDHDIDERNNYDQLDYHLLYPADPLPADWRGWTGFPRTLPPHPAHSVRPGLYSKHGFGVVLLITLPYLIAGRLGAILLLNLVAALVAVNIVLLARRYGQGWGVACLLAIPCVFANPLMSYAYLIFPETFAALAIIYTFRRSREPANNGWQWFGIGCALAILPWLHARFIPAVLGLIAILASGWLRERNWGYRLAGLLPPAIAAVALLAYYLYIYGQPFPSTQDHAGFNTPPWIINAAFGLFLDEQWGLLIHAPIYLLATLGLGALWRSRKTDLWAILTVVLPYLGLVAFYRVWWGEWGPAARYLAPIVPLAIAPIACWARTIRPRAAIAIVAIFGVPGLLIMLGFLADPQLMYNQPDGMNQLFATWAAHFGWEWPKVIPSFQPYALSPFGLRGSWSAALLLITVGLILAGWLQAKNVARGSLADRSESGRPHDR